MVSKVQLSLLTLVAFVLLGDLLLTHVWPRMLLMKHEDEYFSLALSCANVSSDLQEMESTRGDYELETYFELIRSARVASMDCYGEKSLRLYLLSHRVSEHDLDRLSLRATKDSLASVQYFTNQLRRY